MIASTRVQAIQPSATIAVTTKARQLRAQGLDIIGLGAGEPDFPTPKHISQAGIDAINDNQTKYTAVDGTPELKQAIVDKFKRDNALVYQTKQVLVSCGAKQSIFNLALAILDAGDEVIIPAPYWVSYPDIVLIAAARPVVVRCSVADSFKLTPAALAAAITNKTKVLILNSPSNPTGVAYTRAELQALGAVLRDHPHVLIATDDIYELIWWSDEPFSNIVMACPDLYARTIVLNGASKAYSMTGWRIGYAAGDPTIINNMAKIQSQSTSNPCSISQAAVTVALNGDHAPVAAMVVAFKRRHDYVVQHLNAIDGVSCLPSQGAFYAFADMRELMKSRGISDDIVLAQELLEKAHIAVVPGSAFGMDGFIRISYATSDANISKALQRLQAY